MMDGRRLFIFVCKITVIIKGARKMFKKFLFLSAVFIISSCFDLQAQVVVKKSARDRNPTLMYRDIAGNPELSKHIASDLRYCGWFDMVDSGAEYVITGAASGSQVQITVGSGNGSPLFP